MNQWQKSIFTALRVFLAIGMIYYLIASDSIHWGNFKGLVESWNYTVLALILFVIATIIQAIRLHWLISANNMSLSIASSTKLTFIGLFFSTYLPGATGGDLIKIYYASKGNKGKRAEVITVLLLDRFMGLFSLLTLPLILSPFFITHIAQSQLLQALLLISVFTAITIVCLTSIAIKINIANSRLLKLLEKAGKIGHLLSRMLATIHSFKDNLTTILKALAFSYLLQFLMVLSALAIAAATNAEQSEASMLLLIPLGFLANSLPITPGGLGVGEAAMESLFATLHLSGGAETLLGWRLIMILVGLVGLVFYLRSDKRYIKSQQEEN